MDNNNPEIQTPKNKFRSLGLRRSTQKSSIAKTPQSDVKISYKHLQTEARSDVASPVTPKITKTFPTTSTSTNCLPYRLSLSRIARDKYKKKKLEFAVVQSASGLENPSEPEKDDIKEKQLVKHHKHEEKVQELKSLIAIWAEAFKQSIEDLSAKIEPKMETEELIARLGIPPEMIDYT